MITISAEPDYMPHFSASHLGYSLFAGVSIMGSVAHIGSQKKIWAAICENLP